MTNKKVIPKKPIKKVPPQPRKGTGNKRVGGGCGC